MNKSTPDGDPTPKRKAVQMMRAAGGYDYRDALDHFGRLIKRSLETRSTARTGNLQELLVFTQKLQPHGRR